MAKNKGKRAVVAPTTPASEQDIEVVETPKKVKASVIAPNVQAQVDELKAKLEVTDDGDEKKRIRRILRARGWWGGLRSRAGDLARGLEKDKAVKASK